MDHLGLARELEARDVEIADALDVVRALQADVAELHAHARACEDFAAALPEERRHVEAARTEAAAGLEARESDLAAAEGELARAKGGEPEAAARRAATRARDAASSARKRLARVEDDREALERRARETEAERPRLAARTGELAARLAAAPRATAVPAGEPVEWSARARAALFVAAGSLETERERLVREANELAAAALGDVGYATSVELVRRRLERA
jgi:hypothetical protein